MKKLKIISAAFLVIILALAVTYSIKANSVNTKVESAIHTGSETDIYVCPMHPEVTQDKPGTCPKCGMDLILKNEKKDAPETHAKKCCMDEEKCKEMGCDMSKCKEGAGMCSEKCMDMKDNNRNGMKHDMKMMDGCNEKMKSGCSKTGSCCDK